MTDLHAYLAESIYNMMNHAHHHELANPRLTRFITRMMRVFRKSVRQRKKILETEGVAVPPFLIASIATTCNLSCKGCYARENGIASEEAQKENLSAEQWRAIFDEAAALGVNFCLLAGGEPLTRRDVLDQAAQVKDIIFPVFTNGTLIGYQYIDLFKRRLNIIPVISLEGRTQRTDDRRGVGVYQRARMSMKMLERERLRFGVSFTVTTENYRDVTAVDFLRELRDLGAHLVFFVEYVPIEKDTQHLALTEKHVAKMETIVEKLRKELDDVIFLSFPGDEKALDGCMAAGRGFFHIGPDGAAEPCPFSPYSDSNVASLGLLGALKSPLFQRIRDTRALQWEHTGGCTLFEHRDEVEKMLQA